MSGWLDEVYSAEGDTTRLKELYDEWAGAYDEHLTRIGYLSPSVLAAMVGQEIPRGDEAVLDDGVGTGLLGAMLHPAGYANLVGIDLSEGMLAMAEARNTYRELRRMTLGERLDFPDDHFAGAVSCGVFTGGHAPAEGFEEIVRVVRPGGHFVATITDEHLPGGSFGEKMASLEHRGGWRHVRTSERFVALPGADEDFAHLSQVYVFEITASGAANG